MSVHADRWIRRMALKRRMIEPFEEKLVRRAGEAPVISYGLSSYGYDLRVADEFKVFTNVFNAVVDPKAFDDRSFVDPYGISLRRLDPRLAEFDLKKLAASLDPFADLRFDFIGVQTLFDRYLIHETEGVTGRKRRLEAPQVFWLRVAMGLALLEKDRDARAVEFYGVYKSRRACSSTPTLFNSGTLHSQLSSCYLLYCGDSIEEIAETWRRFSHLSKWAGGLGCSGRASVQPAPTFAHRRNL